MNVRSGVMMLPKTGLQLKLILTVSASMNSCCVTLAVAMIGANCQGAVFVVGMLLVLRLLLHP